MLVCAAAFSCGPAALEPRKGLAPDGTPLCVFEPIQFDFDKTELSPANRAILRNNADCANLIGLPLVVTGHTDSRGTAQYNIQKAMIMAQGVCAGLVQFGVTVPLRAASMGEDSPLCTEPTEACRHMNRRVEIAIDPMR